MSPSSREKLLSLLRQCRANGGKVIFDNNYRPRLWASHEEILAGLPADARMHRYRLPDAGRRRCAVGQNRLMRLSPGTQAAGVSEVVIKRGARSCLVAIAGEAAS
ncbi:hypothetical protein ACNKHO_22290 [Shigella flexneri]